MTCVTCDRSNITNTDTVNICTARTHGYPCIIMEKSPGCEPIIWDTMITPVHKNYWAIGLSYLCLYVFYRPVCGWHPCITVWCLWPNYQKWAEANWCAPLTHLSGNVSRQCLLLLQAGRSGGSTYQVRLCWPWPLLRRRSVSPFSLSFVQLGHHCRVAGWFQLVEVIMTFLSVSCSIIFLSSLLSTVVKFQFMLSLSLC